MEYDLQKSLRFFALASKWVLVTINLVLFYITFHYTAYIILSWDSYVIYGFYVKWFFLNYWSFVLACGISAVVFSIVTWKSMAAPLSVQQMIILVAAPTIYCLVFRELVYQML